MTVIRHTTSFYDIDAIIAEVKKDMIKFNTPEGALKIENLYYDPKTEELVWKIEEK